MKYPRTYHLPYSPGVTKDDKKLQPGWFDYYKGREIVITEKLDGENIHMDQKDCYARSDGAPTRSPWSRNIWDSSGGLYWRIKQYIGPDETLFGENLYGQHSIQYNRLTDYFHLFAVNGLDNDSLFHESVFYSWEDVKMMAEFIGVPHVPQLWIGEINSEEELRELVDLYTRKPSEYGDVREGVVIRITDSFETEDFSKYVCKWVRPNHVQTDEHWTKNWKKAELWKDIG